VNLVPFQDDVDLVEFVLAQRDFHRGEVLQDPRLVRGTGDGDDVRTCTQQSQTPDQQHTQPSTSLIQRGG
jgi:hypothetical protein